MIDFFITQIINRCFNVKINAWTQYFERFHFQLDLTRKLFHTQQHFLSNLNKKKKIIKL